MKLIISCLLLGFLTLSVNSQEVTQTVRGTVSDSETNHPLVGSKVKIILSADKTIGSICDPDGNFIIQNVPIGKHTLIISFVGYETKSLPIIVNSGKESVVTILLEESMVTGEEIVITGSKQGETNNETSTVSSQSFSVEETIIETVHYLMKNLDLLYARK